MRKHFIRGITIIISNIGKEHYNSNIGCFFSAKLNI